VSGHAGMIEIAGRSFFFDVHLPHVSEAA